MTDEHEHAMKVAEQAYSAGNLVTCDGYYEFDLDAAAAVIAADRAGLVAEIERLREALEEIMGLPGEINPSNYDHDDVCELNRQFCYGYAIARAALKDTRND